MSLTVQLQKTLPHYDLNVDFVLDQGTLGILGRSGSGKSMTLRCIAGIETPSAGVIILRDRILYHSQKGINIPSCQRRVGFVFQHYALFPHLTVAQNIAYGLRGWSPSRLRQRVKEQLENMQLVGLADCYPHQLSGGQQQRVALARALAPAPDLLLLDEPLSALDTPLRSELERQLSTTLATYQGLTIFVSHNLEELYRVCHQLLVLDRGQVVASGEKHQIFDQPRTLTVAQLTGCKNYSPIAKREVHRVHALDWGCVLQTADRVLPEHHYIAIRAHHVAFTDTGDQPNTFPAWVASTSETPHRLTVYLKLQQPPRHPQDYHLQAEVYKEKWLQFQARPFPWWVHLSPQRLRLLQP
ncbi:MAG: sulfate/molybdate ABC transporter ATP-binding protein [Gloeomargarita sp. HHBFW_bins_205]